MSDADAEILALVSKAESKTDAYNTYKKKYQSAKSSSESYRQRRSELRAVKTALKGDFDDVAGDISTAQRSLARKLDADTKGFAHAEDMSEAVSDDTEACVENDDKGSEMLEVLETEIARCTEKIEDGEADASTYKDKANACKEDVDDIRTQVAELKRDPECTLSSAETRITVLARIW